jgi:ribonuclease HII
MTLRRRKPNFIEENYFLNQGFSLIAGLDEAGRGSMAGPLVAAAVIMPNQVKGKWKNKVRDSKMLTSQMREYLYSHIVNSSLAFSIGIVDHSIIDQHGIIIATKLAMHEAISLLNPSPDYLLIDYLTLADIDLPQKGVVDGDCLCFSIACASIVAKYSRDSIMKNLDCQFPGYGLAKHKGYCTVEHINNLMRLGPSPVHRLSFRPVKDVLTLIV